MVTLQTTLLGCVMKNNPMSGVAQKGSSRSLGLRLEGAVTSQNTGLAFHAQVEIQVRFFCDVAHQRRRHMRVEIIADKVPAQGEWI